MKRLLIDASHILKGCLHAAVKSEHATVVDGAILPAAIDGYEHWLGSLKKTLTELKMVPSQVVFVKDGYKSKDLRRKFLPNYKERPAGVKGFHDEFLKLQAMAEENLLSYGAVSVDKAGVEADDMIAALAAVTDHIIWSGDGDLSAAGDIFYRGEINPNKFLGIAKKHIVVYKSLVGDNSDKLPGAKGFGEQALIDMIGKFGDECLDEFLEMLENKTLQELAPYVSGFKPFQKILDNEDMVYASYQCAKFHHPGWHGINWKARYPKGDGTFPEWDLKVQLVTKANLTPEFMAKFKRQLSEVPWGPSYDIETWSDEESLDWGLRNKTQRGPRLDVYGAHMAGFSITTGPNNNLVYYFPVDHKDTVNVSLDDMRQLLNCCDAFKPMFVWNAEFELPVTRNHMELRFDRGWLPNVMDALIMKSYVDENTPLGLKYSSQAYLDYKQVTFEEVTAGEQPEIDSEDDEEADDYEPPPSRQMNEMTGAETVAYGADDSVCTGALVNLFSLVMLYEGTWKAFEMCELAPAYLCAEAFLNGQAFDMNRLAELTEDNKRKSEILWEKIRPMLAELEWTVGDEIEGTFWKEKLPGCVFDPAFDLSAAELKKVYKQITGEQLKTNLRSVTKIAMLMEEKAPKLAAALFNYDEDDQPVQVEDVGPFNFAAEKLFVPKPELNLGSPKQMQNLLYTAMKFPIRLRGKITPQMREKGIPQGNPKGNESAIRHAIMYDANDWQKELLLLLIEAKALQTDESLFLRPYAEMPNPKGGLVHYSTGQSRTKTRRWAPNGPNISQCSKKSPIRKVYVPYSPDMIFWSFDFSGQELRLTAHRSKCPVMLACYPKDGSKAKDVHSMVGIKVAELDGLNYSYDEFLSIIESDDHPDKKKLKEYRAAGKRQVFGSVYGQTEIGLAEKLLITVDRAAEIVAANDAAFPGVAEWKKVTEERLLRDGFATTVLGARRHLVLDGSWKDKHELRSGINSEIQGPAAEQTKMVLGKLWKREVFDRYEAFFFFPVHDQITGCCVKSCAVEFLKEVHGIMTEQFADVDIPVESSIDIGKNFGELIEVGTVFDEEKIKELLTKY